MQRTLVFVAETFPHPVSEFLSEHGYRVLEARSVAEALEVSEDDNIDAVIIAPGDQWVGIEDLRQRRVTLNLTVHASGSDVLFELSHLFPGTASKPQ